MPSDFTLLPSVKYARDLKKISDNDKRKDRKTKKQFYLNSNFAIDGLLKSGKVLYETEHSTYLKDIISLLLKDNPSLSNRIHVYILRSPSVNAFATADGLVFITLGLLAQVENEAQLAYILSHEITHISKKHALELALESDRDVRASDRRKLSRNGEIDDKSLSKNLFNHEQELEADREGYNIFIKTGYATAHINRVFDVLKYSELPYDDIAFERSFLETDYLKLPNAYFLEKVKAIQGINEKGDDSKSSHPNLFKRRSVIDGLLTNQKDVDKKDFLISKDRFEKLKKVSRFEIAHLQLHRQLLQDAIYTAFLLKKTEKADKYADIITAKALYGLAKFKSNTKIDISAEVIAIDSIEGEGQQVYHLFDKMPSKELSVLATSYMWRMAQKYEKNTDLKTMCNDLIWLLADQHSLKKEDFLKTAPLSITASKPAETAKDTAELSKIDKIKKQEKETNTDWWKYAFVESLKDAAFVAAFDKAVENKKDKEECDTQQEMAKYIDEKKRKGHFLGVQKIVVVNPNYVKVTQAHKMYEVKTNVDLIEGEKNVARFEKLMKENAEAVGLKMTMLNAFDFKQNDAQKLNDFALLKDWYHEQSDAGNMPISGYQQKEIEELAKRYGTDYFMWTGVAGVQIKKPVGMKVFGLLFTIPFAPITLPLMVLDNYEMYYYSVLYNVKTGQNYIIKSEEFTRRDSDMLLNAHIYDTFLQIKTKKGESNDEKPAKKTASDDKKKKGGSSKK